MPGAPVRAFPGLDRRIRIATLPSLLVALSLAGAPHFSGGGFLGPFAATTDDATVSGLVGGALATLRVAPRWELRVFGDFAGSAESSSFERAGGGVGLSFLFPDQGGARAWYLGAAGRYSWLEVTGALPLPDACAGCTVSSSAIIPELWGGIAWAPQPWLVTRTELSVSVERLAGATIGFACLRFGVALGTL